MSRQDTLKKQVAQAVIDYIPSGIVLGVGTGSTVNHLIDALGRIKNHIKGAVSSSLGTTERLQKQGIPLLDLNEVDHLALYIDGTDEVNPQLQLIKGGGAALTKEKIIASVAKKFICIADESKWVDVLGDFGLPVEVLPIARSAVARAFVKLGGHPTLRLGTTTEYGNPILDVTGLVMNEPIALERTINEIDGVVTHGLFAKRCADQLLLATEEGLVFKESPLAQKLKRT